MKILLIYPYFLEERPDPEDVVPCPIGLYWLASVLLEQGHKVEILNWYSRHLLPASLDSFLAEKKPDLIGFSVLHANRWGAIDIARIARQVDPAVKIVLGGVGATFSWQHLLDHFPEIDIIVRGEGEQAVPALLRALESDRSEELGNVPGIAYREGGKLVATEPPPPLTDLDSLPIPAKYFTYQHLSLTRGCPWDCTFCGSPSIWGRKVRFRSADHFVAELQLLHRRGVRLFYISDDTFTVDKHRVIEICQKILALRLRIAWVAISRVTYVDDEILYWMRVAGCIQISYGVESGSDRIRAVLNKKITRTDIVRAFSLTTRYGILARAYFIYGSPGETRQSIEETLDLIREIKPLAAIFYILDIFPGTALYREFLKRTGASDDIWLERVEDILYCQTDPDLPEPLVLQFGDRLRSQYYAWLPSFAEAIELVDRPEMAPFHADFLARLAMTFSHGDYAQNDRVPNPEATAQALYSRALTYHPDCNALLGLAVIRQQHGAHAEVVALLEESIDRYPDSEALNVCLGISLMALQRFEKALKRFLPFENSKQALYYTGNCYQALGAPARARSYFDQARALADQ